MPGLGSKPGGQRGGECDLPWGGGRVLVWGLGSKEFKQDSVHSLEAAVGLGWRVGMAGFKFQASLRC